MMRLVINKCFGGFSLSDKAVARMAELQGRKAYFFQSRIGAIGNLHDSQFRKPYVPCKMGDPSVFFVIAFDIPNPNEVLNDSKEWHEMSKAERLESNRRYSQHQIDNRPSKRDDPLLLRVVEELGAEANGRHAELAIVEIPDGVDWELDEYDGIETVHEKHRSWS